MSSTETEIKALELELENMRLKGTNWKENTRYIEERLETLRRR